MRTHKRWLTAGMVLLALLLVSAVGVSAVEPIDVTVCDEYSLTNAAYRLADDIAYDPNADGPCCILIRADGVSFDGQGDTYTITVDTTGPNGAAYCVEPDVVAEVDGVSLFDLTVEFDDGTDGAAVYAENVVDFSLTGSTFDGDVDVPAAGDNDLPAVIINTGAGVTISGNTIKDFNEGVDVDPSNDVTISGNTISSCAYEGLDFELVSNLVISGNTIFKNDMGMELQGVTHVTISGNKIYDNGNNSGDHGIKLGPYDGTTWNHVTVGPDNEIYYNAGDGLWAMGDWADTTEENLTVDGNNIHDNDDDGIRLLGIFGKAVVSNNIVKRHDENGLDINGCDDVLVQDNEFSGNDDAGMDVYDSTGVTAERNIFSNNEDEGVEASDCELTLLSNWIELNGEEGVETDINNMNAEYVTAHGNVICDNCRDIESSDCEEDDMYTPVQVDSDSGDPTDFEHNFWCAPAIPQWFQGAVDYQPWISMALSAARKRVTGSLISGGYAVPDGVKVQFATDLGWFDRPVDMHADVRPPEGTKDGKVTAKIFSNVAGYATVSAWARESFTEEFRLVTFKPRKPSINFPPLNSEITSRRPNVRWTKSPSAEPTLVYQLRLFKVRPRPRKQLLEVVTDETSYRTPYLRGRKFVVKVRACLDELTDCSRWSRSVFKIVKK